MTILSKLSSLGIEGKILAWIKDWLLLRLSINSRVEFQKAERWVHSTRETWYCTLVRSRTAWKMIGRSSGIQGKIKITNYNVKSGEVITAIVKIIILVVTHPNLILLLSINDLFKFDLQNTEY